MTNVEMNYCRRCGQPLTHKQSNVFVCPSGHTLFANASPAASLLLVDARKRALLSRRGIEPGIGKLDIPGGFCDGDESLEAALEREVQEELGLTPDDYTAPVFVLSAIDPYLYKGETIAVLSAMFWASLQPGATPVAHDDVGSLEWLSYGDIDFGDFQFDSGAQTLRRLHKMEII